MRLYLVNKESRVSLSTKLDVLYRSILWEGSCLRSFSTVFWCFSPGWVNVENYRGTCFFLCNEDEPDLNYTQKLIKLNRIELRLMVGRHIYIWSHCFQLPHDYKAIANDDKGKEYGSMYVVKEQDSSGPPGPPTKSDLTWLLGQVCLRYLSSVPCTNTCQTSVDFVLEMGSQVMCLLNC